MTIYDLLSQLFANPVISIILIILAGPPIALLWLAIRPSACKHREDAAEAHERVLNGVITENIKNLVILVEREFQQLNSIKEDINNAAKEGPYGVNMKLDRVIELQHEILDRLHDQIQQAK